MILVRPFRAGDAAALAALMTEMTRHYGAAVAAERNVEAEVADQAARVETLVASDGAALLGFATFATLFPVGALLSLTYVQQVYVAAAARRGGVARLLLAAVARCARERGCRRLEWLTSPDNAAARALYDGLGAAGAAKVHYVLDGEALDRLADAPRDR